MKQAITNFIALVYDRFILIGIGMGVIFWIIESVMHVYVFHRFDFLHSVLSPGLHEGWMRLIIVGMFISFGCYAQWLMNARRRAETAVRLAHAELTQIFETSADAMRVVDKDYTMLRANETFCDLANTTKGDAVGKKCYEVFRGPLCHTAGCPLTRILNGEERVECDVEKLRDEGPEIPCIVTATPFRAPTGELIGIVEDFKDISERTRREEELRQSRRRMRELAFHLETAREEERTRIAREIHDELGQALTALKMELHWCIQRLPRSDNILVEKASALSGLIDTNVQLVQRISSELRPGLLDNLGISAAIEWQAGQFQDRTGIECDIVCEPDDIVLDQSRSTVIFRIFQEALTNIARHANAGKVEIVLRRTPGGVELEVSDNGVGITDGQLSDAKSFGLMGIRERAQSLGGEVRISGIRNRGTTVSVHIPTDEMEAQC
jgi:PAS domain S-box-containing protein